MGNEEIKPPQIGSSPETPPSTFLPPSSPQTYFPERSRRPKSYVIKIIIGIVLILVVGVGLALATRIWDPVWNPFRPTSEKVINEMILKMGKLKTLHFDTKIGLVGKEGTKEVFQLSMDFDTDLDNTDSQSPKSVGGFYIALGFEGMQFSLAGESKIIEQDSYLKLTTIPALPFLEPFFEILGIDLEEIKDQWIQINEEQLMKTLLGSSYTPEIEEEIQKEKEQQGQIIQKIKTILENKRLYIVKREYPDKEIKGKKTYHYLVALNEKEVKQLILEPYKALIETMKFGTSPTEEQWQEFQREISIQLDEFFAKIGDITAELWIGKEDNLLYKVKGEKIIDLQKLEEPKRGVIPLPGSRSPRGIIDISIEIDFSDFDKSMKVEAPEEYKTLEEILGPLFKQIIKPQSHQKIINNMLSISSLAELVYFPDYSNISCENKQIGYYCDDIEKYGGSKPVIHSSRDAYCAYVETFPTQYFCIDSKGFRKTVFVYPGEKTFCDGKTFICPSAAPPSF